MGGWLSPSMTQNSAGCFCSCRRCWTFAQHVSDCFQIWFGCAQNACFNLRTKIYAWKHVKASGLGWFTVVVFAMVSRFVSIVLILVNSKTCVEPGKSYLMPCQFFKILTFAFGICFPHGAFCTPAVECPLTGNNFFFGQCLFLKNYLRRVCPQPINLYFPSSLGWDAPTTLFGDSLIVIRVFKIWTNEAFGGLCLMDSRCSLLVYLDDMSFR